ncbi:hypothetical protein BHE74_00058165 [Ensete ventricosum]|nr:hypothetical protein BHE74_00058165 [Ensete ventricosum]
MTSPHAGSATHGPVGCKGSPAAAKAPCKGVADHGQSPLQGQPPTCVAGGDCPLRGRKGQPRSQGYRLHGRPLLLGQRPRKATSLAREVLPRAATPAVGAAAHAEDVQRRLLRRVTVAQ